MISTQTMRNFGFCACTIALAIGGFGCSHSKPKVEPQDTASVEDNVMGSSDQGNAMGLQTIHFSYDSPTLSSGEKTILRSDADILKSHSTVKLQIEGHCDQRGGIQYNIALGEKRAEAVKHFLVDQGISAARLATISYGKEKPVDTAQTDEAYAKNRRANLVITSR